MVVCCYDEIAMVESESEQYGTQGSSIDYALLIDGLQSEREQGITIDVAYRFFQTAERKFIAADTPGHEQYTRNMVTGASTADLAIILVDCRNGIKLQTRRHFSIAYLLGIRDFVLAVNKMDKCGFSRDIFEEIDAEFRNYAEFRPLSTQIHTYLCINGS